MSVTATTTTSEAASGSAAAGAPVPGEASLIGRFVAILTPLFTIVAGAVAAWVGRHIPGAALDQPEIVAFMGAVVTAVLTSSWKWLSGWQQHERLVAQGLAAPVKPASTPATSATIPGPRPAG